MPPRRFALSCITRPWMQPASPPRKAAHLTAAAASRCQRLSMGMQVYLLRDLRPRHAKAEASEQRGAPELAADLPFSRPQRQLFPAIRAVKLAQPRHMELFYAHWLTRCWARLRTGRALG